MSPTRRARAGLTKNRRLLLGRAGQRGGLAPAQAGPRRRRCDVLTTPTCWPGSSTRASSTRTKSGHQPRAAAHQHGGFVGRPSAGGDSDRQPLLAADYVRTHTDLGDDGGRERAPPQGRNGILAAAGSDTPRCAVWPLSEPTLFAPARRSTGFARRSGAPQAALKVRADGTRSRRRCAPAHRSRSRWRGPIAAPAAPEREPSTPGDAATEPRSPPRDLSAAARPRPRPARTLQRAAARAGWRATARARPRAWSSRSILRSSRRSPRRRGPRGSGAGSWRCSRFPRLAHGRERVADRLGGGVPSVHHSEFEPGGVVPVVARTSEPQPHGIADDRQQPCSRRGRDRGPPSA